MKIGRIIYAALLLTSLGVGAWQLKRLAEVKRSLAAGLPPSLKAPGGKGLVMDPAALTEELIRAQKQHLDSLDMQLDAAGEGATGEEGSAEEGAGKAPEEAGTERAEPSGGSDGTSAGASGAGPGRRKKRRPGVVRVVPISQKPTPGARGVLVDRKAGVRYEIVDAPEPGAGAGLQAATETVAGRAREFLSQGRGRLLLAAAGAAAFAAFLGFLLKSALAARKRALG